MSSLVQIVLSLLVGTALFLMGVPILLAALRWTAQKLRIFACANRSVAVRIGEWVNAEYGECETKTALLTPGVVYTNRLEHYATDEGEWDFDYRLFCDPPEGYGVVVDDPENLFGEHYDRGSDTTFADAGKIARIGIVRFGICADFDRKNGIDATDEAVCAAGGVAGTLYHWVNDNRSSGSGWDAAMDMMPWGGGDARRDEQVNGVCDTLDFTPVWINLAPAIALLDAMEIPYEFRLSQEDEAVNVVWTSQSRVEAGAFLTNNIPNCGPTLRQNLIEATTQRVTKKGLRIPGEVLEHFKNNADHGVLLLEGRHVTQSPLVLSCIRTDRGTTLISTNLPLCISAVTDMYRWIDLRPAAENLNFQPTIPQVPARLPDAACNSDLFTFVHGYNMEYAESIAWAGEFFKRLRQTGSSAKFAAVAWKGNYSQFWMPKYEYVTPNYYWNVHNAFMTSLALKRAIEQLPGSRKFIAAHSLGNMLVSAAVRDHSMPYARYFMLNAAVPLEAYDSDVASDEMRRRMTPPAWTNYPLRVRASHWYELFDENDPRRGLTWKNRFGTLANTVNYFSSEDEVLWNGNGEETNLLSRANAWYNQETHKGVFPMRFMTEAGWGFNSAHDIVRRRTQVNHGDLENIIFYDRRTPGEAALLTDEQLRTEPFFGHFDNRTVYTNQSLAAEYEYRSAVLARGIPAETFALGANNYNGFLSFDQATICKDEKNKDLTIPGLQTAIHSFFISSPYYYNHKFFESILKRGEMK